MYLTTARRHGPLARDSHTRRPSWRSKFQKPKPLIQSVSTNMSSEFLRPSGQEGDYLYAEGFSVKQGG